MSIHIMAMSDLGDALITRGLAARVVPSNKLLFLKWLVMLSLVIAKPLGWMYGMPIIFRYVFD